MEFDGTLEIATGAGANSLKWKNKKILWSELAVKLSETTVTNETYAEYLTYSKAEQGKIKDVGGYVGGYINTGRRKPENITYRQLLTLDVDFAHLGFWEDYLLQFKNAAVLHATHKHSDELPRFRLVMPLSRECSPDEYAALARKVAGILGIELFDNTTFQTARLMFWPSTSKDVEYYAKAQDGDWLDVDEILRMYDDWMDSSQWPTADKRINEIKNHLDKQEDPETKRGIIGAFCRTYTLTDAIDKFLSNVYIATSDGNRYTYRAGSAAAGLVVYDNKFAYSHHGTDPCGNKLSNAYDLVRIHKFGHLDSKEDYKGKSKSSEAMDRLAQEDEEVKLTIGRERIESIKIDFPVDLDESSDSGKDNVDLEWMKKLEVDNRGKYLSSANNINLVFANDRYLSEVFKENLFDNKRYVFRSLPWRKIKNPEPIKNVDYAGIRNYIESVYNITGTLKIEDGLALAFQKDSFNPIIDYLEGLKWDKKERLDNLLIDYFGAEDSLYSREAIRKTLVAAVARIFKPGVKFDLVLTIVGPQGSYKSTFISKLGKQWFSDTFLTVQGKEALEQIQGAWIIEMAELSGLRKAEVESIKHFISKQEDTFRPAYGRTSETYKRQCVFFGTTNKKDFLRDPSGNRRFIPVDVNQDQIKKSVTGDLTEPEIDQIWAEALVMFKKGETLYMSKEATKLAKKQQNKHSEVDERKGLIESYLDTLLPVDWGEFDVIKRREFFSDPLSQIGKGERQFVCIAEIWCECLGKSKQDMDRYKTREVNDIMKSLDEWEQHSSTKNFKHYGKQKYYSRRLA